jgi:hypothetical protein
MNQHRWLRRVARPTQQRPAILPCLPRAACHTHARSPGRRSNPFARSLHDAGLKIEAERLASDPGAWRDISWGLVAAFVQWQLQQGYAVASINRALSSVKVHCKLATQASVLSPDTLALIRIVSGYSTRQGKRVDAGRSTTRIGSKKAQPTWLTLDQARALKDQSCDTPQGQRDALLMCLLLDHGLRVGEVAALQVDALDLTADTLQAAMLYLAHKSLIGGQLLRGSRKDGGHEQTRHPAACTPARSVHRIDGPLTPRSAPLLGDQCDARGRFLLPCKKLVAGRASQCRAVTLMQPKWRTKGCDWRHEAAEIQMQTAALYEPSQASCGCTITFTAAELFLSAAAAKASPIRPSG